MADASDSDSLFASRVLPMDSVGTSSGALALTPNKSPAVGATNTNPHSSAANFPIIIIAIIAILITAFILLGYSVFIIKCYLNRPRALISGQFHLANTGNLEPRLSRGLDQSAIMAIPVIKFKRGGDNAPYLGESSSCKCSICLQEFQEEEELKFIPNCSHVFHVDCIGVWLQSHANCPLCRTSVSRSINQFPHLNTSGDQENVMIEFGNSTIALEEERSFLGESSNSTHLRSINAVLSQKSKTKLHKVNSLGNGCEKRQEHDDANDDIFAVKPLRRSFSLDSYTDWNLYSSANQVMLNLNQRSHATPTEPLGRSSAPGGRSVFPLSRNVIF